jgi:hypothetical protein
MIDGEQQARRVARDLLDARLVVRARADRRGVAWESHPLAGEPDAVFTPANGPTAFVYSRPLQAFELIEGRRVRHISVAGSLVVSSIYSETGDLIERSTAGRGEPRWN